MDEHTPQFPNGRHRAGRGTRERSWVSRHTRGSALTVCAAALVVAVGFGAPSVEPAATPAAGTADAALPAATPAAATGHPALDAQIDAIIHGHPEYQIGVALLDLSDGATASQEVNGYGVEEAFVAASTAKVLAAGAYYHLVETGQASLDNPLGAYPAESQLQAMIQQSNNDSWSLIMDAVGHAELTDYAAALGVDYAPTSNTLTAADMARILGALYSGTLLEPGNTAQLLAYMQDTNYETLIPAAVPATITVFHKYGLLGRELHDAAILAHGGRACALVIYTKGDDLSSVPERTEIIRQVTRAVTEAVF